MHDQFLLLHRHFPYKMAETNPVCREHLVSIYDCLLDIFEQGILIGKKDGSIGDVPARNSAMLLFSMADGIALRAITPTICMMPAPFTATS
jgi:hypothetical protein